MWNGFKIPSGETLIVEHPKPAEAVTIIREDSKPLQTAEISMQHASSPIREEPFARWCLPIPVEELETTYNQRFESVHPTVANPAGTSSNVKEI